MIMAIGVEAWRPNSWSVEKKVQLDNARSKTSIEPGEPEFVSHALGKIDISLVVAVQQ